MTERAIDKRNLFRDVGLMVGLLVLVAVVYVLFFHPSGPVSQAPHGVGMPEGGAGSMGAGLELPESYQELVMLGNSTMDEGRFAEAAECYRRALEIDGSSNDVRTDFGACLHAMGLPERAINEFKTVLSSQPDHGIANFNAGIVFRQMNQLDSAKFYWEKTLAVDPDGPMVPRIRELLQGLNDAY